MIDVIIFAVSLDWRGVGVGTVLLGMVLVFSSINLNFVVRNNQGRTTDIVSSISETIKKEEANN